MGADRRRRRRVAALAVGVLPAAVALAGCVGVPHGGGVHRVRAAPSETGVVAGADVGIIPPAPPRGAGPAQLLGDFLVASSDASHDFAAARAYLAPAVRHRWNPAAGVAVYDPATRAIRARGSTLSVAAASVGTIAQEGSWSAPRAPVRREYRFTRVGGEWRLSALPPGLLLTPGDVRRSFRPVNLYFLDPTDRVLVPDRVFLPVGRSELPAALVHRLLGGPTDWLAPAVHTAVPAGTRLRSLSVAGGIATVDLSSPAAPAVTSGPELFAQLVWTLTGSGADISGVRLLVEGVALAGAAPQTQGTEAAFDPRGLSGNSSGFYLAVDPARTLTFVPGPGALNAPQPLSGPPPASTLSGPSVYANTGNGGLVAVLARAGQLTSLYAGRIGGRMESLISAASLTAPTWNAVDDSLWTVVDGSRLSVHSGRAPFAGVGAASPELAAIGDVHAFRFSRDGTRVAMISGSTAAPGAGAGVKPTARLLVARVHRVFGTVLVDGIRAVPTGALNPLDVSWADAGTLAILGAQSGTASPYLVPVDGSTGPALVPGSALSSPIVALAASPSPDSLLVQAGQRIWRLERGVYRDVGPGTAPGYPD